ncbi:MAG TPA: hypothetical protein PK013_08060, partial [Thermosynergistes sp.]|nr:hypothetical protein [Thermosynergistes sp.]
VLRAHPDQDPLDGTAFQRPARGSHHGTVHRVAVRQRIAGSERDERECDSPDRCGASPAIRMHVFIPHHLCFFI